MIARLLSIIPAPTRHTAPASFDNPHWKLYKNDWYHPLDGNLSKLLKPLKPIAHTVPNNTVSDARFRDDDFGSPTHPDG